jgi:NDP-sugar pyrophosphorylase family protein
VRALLLAAGEGTRLRPHTLDRPKAMVEIGGEPAVAHLLRWLHRGGVREVAINLHYRGDVLRAYLSEGERFGVRVTYSDEPAILGTAGALRPLRSFFTGHTTFAVLYGDVVTALELADVRAAHGRAGADATLVLTRVDDPTRAGVVGFAGDGRIDRIVEKPASADVFSDWANAGIYVCGPRVLDYVAAGGPQDFARDLFPAMLADGCLLQAYPSEAPLFDFGSPERLRAADRAVRSGLLSPARETARC